LGFWIADFGLMESLRSADLDLGFWIDLLKFAGLAYILNGWSEMHPLFQYPCIPPFQP
jgi:hypothetical protein